MSRAGRPHIAPVRGAGASSSRPLLLMFQGAARAVPNDYRGGGRRVRAQVLYQFVALGGGHRSSSHPHSDTVTVRDRVTTHRNRRETTTRRGAPPRTRHRSELRCGAAVVRRGADLLTARWDALPARRSGAQGGTACLAPRPTGREGGTRAARRSGLGPLLSRDDGWSGRCPRRVGAIVRAANVWGSRAIKSSRRVGQELAPTNAVRTRDMLIFGHALGHELLTTRAVSARSGASHAHRAAGRNPCGH